MGFSYAPTAVQTRTGAERATLVKRTYGLVFLSVLVTMAGAAFTFTQPALMQAVAQHYFHRVPLHPGATVSRAAFGPRVPDEHRLHVPVRIC